MSAPPSYDLTHDNSAPNPATHNTQTITSNLSSSFSTQHTSRSTPTNNNIAKMDEVVSDPFAGRAATRQQKQAEKERLKAEKEERAKQSLANYYRHIAQKRVDKGEPVITEIPTTTRPRPISGWTAGMTLGGGPGPKW